MTYGDRNRNNNAWNKCQQKALQQREIPKHHCTNTLAHGRYSNVSPPANWPHELENLVDFMPEWRVLLRRFALIYSVWIASTLVTGAEQSCMKNHDHFLLVGLGLAILSGLAPTLLCLSDTFEAKYYCERSFFAPYAVALAFFVLLPFVRARTHKLARAAMLVTSAVANLAFASWLFDRFGSFYLPIILSTVVVCVLTASFAAIEITVRYIAIACMAGLVVAFVFPILIIEGVCMWGCTWRNIFYFAGAWSFWHTAIFVAIYTGKRYSLSS